MYKCSMQSIIYELVSVSQEGKTNLDLLEQETVSDSGINWAYANLHLTPDYHTSIPPFSFYRPDALSTAQPTA